MQAEYTRMVEDRVEECVAAAIADCRPARASWARRLCNVAVNRRENKKPEVPAI